MDMVLRSIMALMLLGLSTFAFAGGGDPNQYGLLIDPPVSAINDSSKAVEVTTYSDFPRVQKIIKHSFIVPAMQKKIDKDGIDYYAKSGSGSKRNQPNRVVVMIFDAKTHALVAVRSKVFELYGAKALSKDKQLMLNVHLKDGQDVEITML